MLKLEEDESLAGWLVSCVLSSCVLIHAPS